MVSRKISDLDTFRRATAVARASAKALARACATGGTIEATHGTIGAMSSRTSNRPPVHLRAHRSTSPYHDPTHFVMVEKAGLDWLDELHQESPPARRVIDRLVRLLSPGNGGVVIASRQALLELMPGMTLRTLARAINTLVQGGYVQRVKIGTANGFAVNERIAWVGHQRERVHAVFSATVVASSTEQDQFALNPPPPKPIPVARLNEMVIAYGPGKEPPAQEHIPGMEPVVRVDEPTSNTNGPSHGAALAQSIREKLRQPATRDASGPRSAADLLKASTSSGGREES